MTLNSAINIATSGLTGFTQELQTISNNVANLNTPGYKATETQFADLFPQNDNSQGNPQQSLGEGLQTLPPVINFSAGQVSQTGISTNLSTSANSFFVLRDPTTGQILYTQDGQFQFNSSGVLVDSTGKYHVQALSSNGILTDLTQNGLQTSLPKASSTITLNGNLSTTTSPQTVTPINVIDANGGTHVLTATFTNSTSTPGTWSVAITDSSGNSVASGGAFVFSNGTISTTGGGNSFSFTYSPAGAPAMNLTLTLASTSTYLATGSAMSVQSVDGYTAGSISSTSFNQNGTLVVNYSNGNTANGPTVALANFANTSSLTEVNNNAFLSSDSSQGQLGTAGINSTWGTISNNSVEGSNVNLSAEFSNMISTQRGYQASSEVISTVNQMMQNLFDMKGH